MDNPVNKNPPRLFLALFRRFCEPEFREDIEGDLLERFQHRLTALGARKARWLFIKDVLLLFRPGIIKDLKSQIQHKFLNMKKSNWIKLTGMNLLFIIAIILPFIPGPPNKLVIGLSAVSQFAGFFGLVLVPIGIIWTVIEIRKWRNSNNENLNYRLPFYLAIIATVIITAACLILAITVIIINGALIGIAGLILIALGLKLAIKEIKKLKYSAGKFNPVPIYLFTIPLIAFLTRVFLVGPVSDYSRDFAIKRSEALIASIEEYKNKEGQYPESINELETRYKTKIPGPYIMGILDFRYNKINDRYSISFSQWLECGSLEEIVLYDKKNLRNNLTGQFAKYDYGFDLCRVKGAFAIHSTMYENWRIYLVD